MVLGDGFYDKLTVTMVRTKVVQLVLYPRKHTVFGLVC